MGKTIVHVGISKSGTTSLQNNVFARLPNIANLGRPNHTDEFYRSFLAAVIGEGDNLAGADPLMAAVASEQRPVIISDETLAGAEVDIAKVAQRLAALLPEAEILITIRRQDRALVSWWMRHMQHLSWRACFDDYAPSGAFFGRIAYDEVATIFERSFGRENVRVMLFEEMTGAPEVFMGRLAPVIGVPVENLLSVWHSMPARNPTISRRQQLYRHARRLLPFRGLRNWLPGNIVEEGLRFLAGGRRAAFEIPAADRARIEEIYGPGNRAVAAAYGLPLDRWGYPGF